MSVRVSIKRLLTIVFAVALTTSGLSATAHAHVTVKPAETVTGSSQVFTMSVPNEKDIPTTSIKLLIPESVSNVRPTVKAGWQITTEKQGTGDSIRITSITWSDGEIPDVLRDEFTFSALVPEQAAELQWKAYQTYRDGSTVAWDQKEHEDGHGSHESSTGGPLSVTKVVDQTAADAKIAQASDDGAVANTAARQALSVAAIGLLLSFAAIYFATRNRQR